MDDDLDQLEAELTRLRPATPPRDVAARIGRALAPRRKRAVTIHWWWSAVLPAAAAIAILSLVPARAPANKNKNGGIKMAAGSSIPRPAMSDIPSALKPVTAENVLYAAQDEGLVTLDDGTTARRERLSYVDTITWRNPRTNASLTWTVPREEVRVVPVHFQ